VTLTWLGVSTFRVEIGSTVLFLDAYVDRMASAEPNGMTSADVDRADAILVGHSHFDHCYGAQVIAPATGAQVYGSYETVRILAAAGVDEAQLVPLGGGEPFTVGPDEVHVRAYPTLHSCLWATMPDGFDDGCHGDQAVLHDERARRLASLMEAAVTTAPGEIVEHVLATNQGDRGDGGPLAYLLDTPAGRIWWNDTSGIWTGIANEVSADVAIIGSAGRPNLDGEPYQGSLGEFVALQADLLGASRVLVCHHDDWLPPVTRSLDVAPVKALIEEAGRELIETKIGQPVVVGPS